MNILENYLLFLNEKDEKIHPKTKAGASWFAATPASDVVAAGIGAAGAIKHGASVGKIISHSAVTAAASLAGYAAYRVIRGMFDKCTGKCGTLEINTTKRQLCLLNCKKMSLEKQLEIARKHNDVEKSKKFTETLNKVNNKIIQYNKYISSHSKSK